MMINLSLTLSLFLHRQLLRLIQQMRFHKICGFPLAMCHSQGAKLTLIILVAV